MSTSEVEAMKVMIGSEPVLVATAALVQIVQFTLLPQLPFLQPWAKGVGPYDGALLPAVALERQGSATQGTRVEVKGLVLQSGHYRWILMIDVVVGLTKARIVGGSFFQSWNGVFPGEWLLDGATPEQEVFPIINSGAMKVSIYG